ncbi:MAG: MBL fold metallo-hydrolase [Methanomassiliicoccales archaeon]|nr:MBL fold metallo-hydrolase [Methanomassiliicoccales archaeon]
MTTITFLGTGGGRFATIYQPRNTGGIYITNEWRIHLDPGPGALVNLSRASIDPGKTDAILISHCHPDHYTDAEILIEGMARGGFRKRGILIGSESVLQGSGNFGPAISSYHLGLPEKIKVMSKGSSANVIGLSIEATPTRHSDPTGIGFKLHTRDDTISYVGDSELGPDIIEAHKGSRVLIICLTRPIGSRIPYHMCTEDAAILVEKTLPEVAILTHFGMKLLHEGAEKQSAYIEKQSGVRTIAATDLMTVNLGKTMRFRDRTRTENRA